MEFFHYYKSRQGEMIRLLKQLVQIESPTNDKKAVDTCSSFIIQELKRIGAKITPHAQNETGDFFVAEYQPIKTKEKKNQILVLIHVDTVWPVGTLKKMPFYLEGHKAFGPGALDMKAGLVMILYSLKTLYDLNIPPRSKITIFINSCEEIGSAASHTIIQQLSSKSLAVLCLEPAIPGGALKMRRKGRMVLILSAKGKAAHAGDPDSGINAIDELILQLKRIKRLKTKNISINTGLITGGENINTVPQKATASLDIRFWTKEQAKKIKDYFKQMKPIVPGAKITYKIQKQTHPMELTHASAQLYKKVKNMAQALNIDIQMGKTGGGSDACIASHMNIATLDGLGPDGHGIHAEDEHILIPSLVERTTLLTELLIHL